MAKLFSGEEPVLDEKINVDSSDNTIVVSFSFNVQVFKTATIVDGNGGQTGSIFVTYSIDLNSGSLDQVEELAG